MARRERNLKRRRMIFISINYVCFKDIFIFIRVNCW